MIILQKTTTFTARSNSMKSLFINVYFEGNPHILHKMTHIHFKNFGKEAISIKRKTFLINWEQIERNGIKCGIKGVCVYYVNCFKNWCMIVFLIINYYEACTGHISKWDSCYKNYMTFNIVFYIARRNMSLILLEKILVVDKKCTREIWEDLSYVFMGSLLWVRWVMFIVEEY